MSAAQVIAACAATAAVTLVVLSALASLRFRRLPGSFTCRLRSVVAWRRRHGKLWRVRNSRAVWAHDVLLVQSGLLRLGVTPVPARVDRGASVETLQSDGLRGLGSHVVVLRLTTYDDRPFVVATASRDRSTLAGPFLAACVPGLPRAPHGHGG